MKKRWSTLLLSILLSATAVQGQNSLEVLNRSHVGVVYVTQDAMGEDVVEVQLKFDFSATPAELTYRIDLANPSLAEPFAGRWDPDSTESVGFMRHTSNSRFYLRNAQTNGEPTLIFDFHDANGGAGWKLPMMGDWDDDDVDSAGIYNRTLGRVDLRTSNAQPDFATYLGFPQGGDLLPVAGNWDGVAGDGIAIFLPDNGVFRAYDDPTDSGTSINYGIPKIPPGAGPLLPVAGDWNHDGKDFFGVYGLGDQTFYLLFGQSSDDWDIVFPFPVTGSNPKPVAGSWDGKSFRYAVPLTEFDMQRPKSFPQLIATGNHHDLYVMGASEVLGNHESMYYNRYSNSASELLYSNDHWAFAPTMELLDNAGATALGTLFSSLLPVFRDPDDEFFEKLVVYVVEPPQKPGMDDNAGWVCLSYSHDGLTWTDPIFARTTDPAAMPVPCVEPLLNNGEVLSEAVSGFRDGSKLYFGVMSGDFGELPGAIGEDLTLTRLFKATLDQPWYFEKQELPQPPDPPRELFTPDGMNTPNTGERWVYNWGINLDFTYDPIEHAVYWARTYPYPYDEAGGIPCGSTQCSPGIGQNPNRAQIYRKRLTLGQSFDEQAQVVFSGPWELLWDLGGSMGYPTIVGSVCSSTELIDSIQIDAMGYDLNAVTFVKDANGYIARDSEGKRSIIFGGAAVKDRANGECDFQDRSMIIWPLDHVLDEINDPPVANDDLSGTLWMFPITLPFKTLLANDTDPDEPGEPGGTPRVCGFEDPDRGTIDVGADSVTYTAPPGGFLGTAIFEYRICDDYGGYDSAEIWIRVGGPPSS